MEFIGCSLIPHILPLISAFRAVSPSPSARCDEYDSKLPAGIVLTMVRPCFLVIDREFPGSISTRKLVIETAKFNVLTAYSAQKGIDTLRMFSAIHGVVPSTQKYPWHVLRNLVKELKKVKAGSPIIAICGPGDNPFP